MPFSDYFAMPTSFETRRLLATLATRDQLSLIDSATTARPGLGPGLAARPAPHSGHPDFGHLTLLVFEAVLEVVCVSLPGYIVAKQGMFDEESQKFLANINVMLFTPCLIFTKLASQLTAEKLVELAIIPIIFLVQTLVSIGCSRTIAALLRLPKRPRNFLIAMSVFGNSNSLPISLVISLSKTLKGLHWDKVPNDNDNEVAARGILYLVIFQQLGLVIRWSWGYKVLLAPASAYTIEEGGTKETEVFERGASDYRDASRTERHRLLDSDSDSDREDTDGLDDDDDDDETRVGTDSPGASRSESGFKTPRTPHRSSAVTSRASSHRDLQGALPPTDLLSSRINGTAEPHSDLQFPPWPGEPDAASGDGPRDGLAGHLDRARQAVESAARTMHRFLQTKAKQAHGSFPKPLRQGLAKYGAKMARFWAGLWDFMNPPLWAMLLAMLVASVPRLQHLFFDRGTFLKNSVTRALEQTGGVAVPLVLVVLGANLARNTTAQSSGPGDPSKDVRLERKLLWASLISRMVFPTIILAPIIAVTAKYGPPVSILDDKIFIIVIFLLSGAPPAIQLSQITTLNGVYPDLVARLLFHSYVIWILPSTLMLVLLALETVEWSER